MAKKICKGDSIFIPFRSGESISDSQLKPRMYMSMESFVNHFPGHYLGTKDVELVEYTPVVHGRWEPHPNENGFDRCSVCRDCVIYANWADGTKWGYCPNCGARMDGGYDG